MARSVPFLLAGSLTGTALLPAFAILSTENFVSIQADITNHGVGVLTVLSMTADLSLDGGLTWNQPGSAPFPISWGRAGGAAPNPGSNNAFVTVPLPSPGSTTRQLRASITADAPLVTSAAAVFT